LKPLKTLPDNVPEALRAVDSWLLWKLKPSTKADGSETWLKVPYYADGTKRRGVLGTQADRRKLTTFARAVQVLQKGGYAGIGFAPMPDYELTILDIDSCIGQDGAYSEFAQQVIDTGTYVERSPSGKGLRAVYTGEALINGKRNGHIENGERIEIYCGSAFVTITGQSVGGDPLPVPKKIKKVLAPVMAGAGGGTTSAPQKVDNGEVLMSPDAAAVPELTIEHARVILNKLPEVWGQPGHGTWYRVAAALHLQFDGSEEAYQLLDEWSQGVEGYDEESNRRRWNAGFSHAGGREGLTTMRNLVFESINNGGLRVKKETMQKWGLARKVDEDFEPGSESAEATLPEYAELDRMADIGQMISDEAEPVDWLVEDMIPRGNVTLLAGGSGTSKSYFTLQLTGSAAVGIEEFAGLKITQGGFRTAYLAYEDSRAALHTRVREVSRYLGEHVDILGDGEYQEALRTNLLMLPAEILDSGAWTLAKTKRRYEPMEVTPLAAYLKDYVNSRGIDLLVFDTGSEIHTGDENSASDMVVLMRALRVLATSANCAVLVIQHVQKSIWGIKLDEMNQASIRGSSVLVDKSRNVVMLARMPRVDAIRYGLPDDAATHENYVALKHVKANLGGYVALRVFERTSKGLLVFRPEIQERDPNLTAIEEDAVVEETTAQRRAAQFDRLREQITGYIAEQNATGVTPSSTMIRAHAMGTFGCSDGRARAVIELLESEKAIERAPNPEYPRSANWRVISSSSGIVSP
jgi:KaiC/GvpD/RAD55 family RecA-like ATPase